MLRIKVVSSRQAEDEMVVLQKQSREATGHVSMTAKSVKTHASIDLIDYGKLTSDYKQPQT